LCADSSGKLFTIMNVAPGPARVAVAAGPGSSGATCELAEDGSPQGGAVDHDDLRAAIAGYEARGPVRWVWAATPGIYPALLRAGVRVARCHDLGLVRALIGARDDHDGRDGRDGRDDPAPAGPGPPGQQPLFDPDLAGPPAPEPAAAVGEVVAEHADQLARIGRDDHPARFGLLAAAESTGALAAAEMSLAGLPWRADVHDALLTELLGQRPRPSHARPARLAELAAQITAAFGSRHPVNPDSPAQLLRAFAAAGIRLTSTRMSALNGVQHPAVAPLIEYKELARLHSAFGWSWLDTWVAEGRFRPEYVVGGVVSGRWASRGGGALQIPRLLRRAVIADPGWELLVADAAQLEPRVLAAMSGDRALAAAAAGSDLYAELAEAFGGDRSKAKVALLSAMYGGAGGEARQLLAVLRQRFGTAAAFVEAAARAGEEGRVVRSVLGRTCPRPSAGWRAVTEEARDPDAGRDPGAERASRARGRFTRNFVIQASAADWALVMLVCLRARLSQISQNGPAPPELVFFQHDEVLVHCPADQAEAVAESVARAAQDATSLVFGPTPVTFPMAVSAVGCYADAK
jgi:hypothetical protein